LPQDFDHFPPPLFSERPAVIPALGGISAYDLDFLYVALSSLPFIRVCLEPVDSLRAPGVLALALWQWSARIHLLFFFSLTPYALLLSRFL